MNNVTPIRSEASMSTRDEYQRRVPTDVLEVNARVDKHEAVCAMRYEAINAQLRRLERWFVTLITAVIGFGAAIILKGGAL